jgi:hypothetical protein
LNVIRLPNGQRLNDANNIIIQLTTITPEDAARWLKCNHNNRPVRRGHVKFLAGEILNGNWQVNGQGIVISDNEEVLDGQHRLMAVIESGIAIKTLVIYGIDKAAFKTIDTGAVRTGADALSLWYPDIQQGITKAVGAAVAWCNRMDMGFSASNKTKTSNTEVLAYVAAHPSMWRCAEVLQGLPRDARPVSLGMGTAAYEMFQRKDVDIADRFMYAFFTGENLALTSPEYILRAILQKDSQRLSSYPADIKMKMIVKAWNLRRRGRDETSRQAITLGPGDPDQIRIL